MDNLKKNKQGYGYKYTDLSAIHNYLEKTNQTYTQYIQKIDGDDYVFTRKYKDGEFLEELQGCRVVQATLSGKSNPAQEQGSALTYARRYSLLLAYGLATEDDDGEKLTKTYITKTQENALRTGIHNKNISNDEVIKVLKQFGYNKLSEILVEDIQEIRDVLLGDD